ncbi:MAG: N utilization substance protein B-like protein [Parcubacteria group bacterium GW2011_GWA2_43_11]|nr:MAG: N utilization substance protein B-like protein [Parcubacteria group bacterium GW2011_GWA2_43_11]
MGTLTRYTQVHLSTMSNRHLSRSIVLQTLFEWDTNHEDGNGDSDAPDVILTRNIEEFATDTKDKPFMKRLLDGVITKQSDLDAVISKAAPEWPIDKIARVDRNILRLGLYELLFSELLVAYTKSLVNPGRMKYLQRAKKPAHSLSYRMS